ncbi:MAG: ABC transporter permease [Candidatus Krumholzibacteriota bacterium]|nr:ABC transporter permease [Candidatus Krumholzibacteriota bacterium]
MRRRAAARSAATLSAARAAVLPGLLAAILSAPACAHDLDHAVSRGEAVVITLQYAGGEPFSYESYEVLPAGEDIPYQTGRTDAAGRIVFVPDHEGAWRVRAFSEDGHGVDLVIEAGGGAAPAPAGAWQGLGPWSGLAAGLGTLFGLFGVINLFARRRTGRPL